MSEEHERLYEEAQRRLRELKTLYEASQACLSISDQQGLLAAIIEAAARATDAALGSVMLVDEKKGEYVFGAHYGLSQETIATIEAELHIPLGEGLVGAAVTTGEPVVVANVRTDPRWIPTETKELMRSFLGVPLVGRDGQPLGALNLARPDVGAFDEDHARLLSTFANQAAMAIENARLYEQAQARSRYLETLQRINATLRSTLPLGEVLATITQGTGEALNYVGSLIVVPDATGRRLTLGAVWGSRFLEAAVKLTGLDVASFSLPLTAEENPMARAYLRGELQAWSGEPQRIVVGVKPSISPKLAPFIERAMGAKLAVCVPLPVSEKVAGVLVVFSPREQFPDEEQAMLLGLADQAGMAIENARLYEQARQEITERQRTMGALRESEERYRRLVELSFDAIVIHREGKIVYINAAGAELFGASSPEDLIGKAIRDFVHPAYLELAKARMLQTAEGRIVPLIEEKLIRLDGTGVDGEVVEIPITYRGQPAVQVVVRDITERKQAEEALKESEEKFRSLAEQSPNMIFINKKGRVVYANKKCEEIMGYRKEEFYSHDFDFLTLIAPESIDLIKANLNRHMKGEEVPPYEYTLVTKEGKRVEAIITSKLIRYEGESSILGIVTDITERKRAEEALRESEERLETILNSVQAGIAVIDAETRIIVDANPVAIEMIGMPREQVIGNVCHKFICPAEEGKCPITDLAQSVDRSERVLLKANGEIIPILKSVIPAILGGRRHLIEIFFDITGRKRAEEELRRLKEFNEGIVQSMTEGIIVEDAEGCMTFVNLAAAALLGYSPAELLGQHWKAIVPPDQWAIVQTADERRMRGEADGYELQLIRKDDTRVPVLVSGSPRFEEGRFAGTLAVFTDITERKRAEAALAHERDLLRALMDNIPDTIYFKDTAARFTRINKAQAQVLGVEDPREAVGKTDFDFFTAEHARDAYADEQEIVKSGQPLIDKVERIRRADGEFRWVSATKVPIKGKEGQVTGIVGISRDITERKQREEEIHRLSQFRERIIDNANVWLNVLDEKRNVLLWNKAAEEISGYSRDEVVGHGKIWGWLYPDEEYRNRISAKAAAIIEKGEVSEDFPTTIRRKDGQTRIIAWNSRNLVDEKGTPIGSIALGRDITERKQLEAQLRQAQKMEAIGTLAGGIAHDFNNILTGILGFASVVHSKLPADSPLRSDTETIIRSAQRASGLTRQLLTFARRGRVEVRPLNLNDVAREVIKLLERTIDKAIAIEPHLTGDLATVEGDASQLHQMLLNLCLNARDAMPQGGQLIIETQNVTLSEEKTRTELDLEAGQYALLSVTDTGIGMDAETQQRLFEPFFTTKEQGRGLGLAMVYGIVRGHGGTIHVYSKPGQGSTFKVYLPVVRRLAQDTALEEVEVLGGSETVLVVEDEESVRALLRRILEEGGYTVLLATNGVEAVELYTNMSTEIDLVVLDIIMPKMGGRQTYERLQEINPEVKVLLSSGYSENGQAQDILAAGARGFLQKPYDLRAVLRKVREALES